MNVFWPMAAPMANGCISMNLIINLNKPTYSDSCFRDMRVLGWLGYRWLAISSSNAKWSCTNGNGYKRQGQDVAGIPADEVKEISATYASIATQRSACASAIF